MEWMKMEKAGERRDITGLESKLNHVAGTGLGPKAPLSEVGFCWFVINDRW